ncbi:hypothetical protein KFL_009980020 [Klebsormidium nitens]|uniref:MYND-type domain-containing protein n=1 Tax=Klebsormidium nitens TaxID=105231 RepID=A0A1Y1INA7_KLENI|nr:hypothetical protein KFL_009980020 [Klebsormidium nitens]|eukprot:GAQ92375.1 hypothetical protein KFL_009980020 [Klebsormidium nitens]
MASKASEFVTQFVRLSKNGQAMVMLPDLKEVIMGMGGPGFEISTQEETAMRLKPNKIFKRVLALMGNKEAVAALVSFIIPKESTPTDAYHVMLGVLLKLSSIPSFAKELADVPAAPAFLLFQRFLYPKLDTASRRRAAWDPSYMNAASLYNQLLNNLIRHSPRFAADALDSRLIHELLPAFPFAPQAFLTWAATPDVTSVTNLAIYQAYTLVCLQDTNPRGPQDIRLKDLALVGDWLDRFLGFLDAFWGRLVACGEGGRIGSAAVHVLRFVDVVEGPGEVNRALFTPTRRAAFLQAVERVCALGKAYETFGRQVAQTVERAGLRMAGSAAALNSAEKMGVARASLIRAEALFKKLRTAKKDGNTWQGQLRDLHDEVRKGGLNAQDTCRLAAQGCIALLVDILEEEDLTRDRKPGIISATTEGPVWPVLEILVALAEPFDRVYAGANEASCRELAEAAPRLLRFTQGGAVGARWSLLDVLLAANTQYIPSSPGAWRVWYRIYDALPYVPEPTSETRGLILLLAATPFEQREKRETWSGLTQKLVHEGQSGEATWGPDARDRKLCHVALKVLDEGHAAMADVNSPVVYAASTLRFCCQFREAASFARARGGPPTKTKRAGGTRLRGWLQSCRSAWGRFDVAPLEGRLRDAIAQNGGVSFAAEVLRTRGGAGRYVRRNIPEHEDQAGALLLLEQLPGLALRLWEGLAQKYGLKKCSFQECSRDVVETRKSLFKRCSACSRVQYCSKECQASHWKKEHKRTCGKQDGI